MIQRRQISFLPLRSSITTMLSIFVLISNPVWSEVLATNVGYYTEGGEKVSIECSLMGAGALRYPPKARKYKYVGEVIVAFSIGPDGKVVDPHIVDAEPPGIFERSALKYVRSWRYQPPVHDGENIQVDDVAVRIAFQPGR
ncbi:MAG: hypothetical protein CBC09_09155 [Cellvibrionales bacterium TMED49]|nr:MAG: hypothetical protein CBC09_09155 [Cellvibrionales bacterium TMED49]